MDADFHNKKPIFQQIKEQIEDQIMDGRLREEMQAPSTTQLVSFYKVNHLTVAKGVNELVEEEILYKKRGVGMFVTSGAKERLIKKRQKAFGEEYIDELVKEARKLRMSEEELVNMLRERMKK
ncbi:GntR family transcriptional regulator [Marinococcus halophilus]|uniref:GntR family transcriptional regulator n=1 Tax=Marinococcus halophilus TaxID=1371 RepID=A0A510Y3Q3_MARHA|nr:GntR family transcriptional regulator [Marinococcus halophilus]OZT80908.1 GntR family transcriptional regulator [Marinococcus halophilus]GEK57966.1 GntR family transcriptional regulator [Marinococcus halophilus]